MTFLLDFYNIKIRASNKAQKLYLLLLTTGVNLDNKIF